MVKKKEAASTTERRCSERLRGKSKPALKVASAMATTGKKKTKAKKPPTESENAKTETSASAPESN